MPGWDLWVPFPLDTDHLSSFTCNTTWKSPLSWRTLNLAGQASFPTPLPLLTRHLFVSPLSLSRNSPWRFHSHLPCFHTHCVLYSRHGYDGKFGGVPPKTTASEVSWRKEAQPLSMLSNPNVFPCICSPAIMEPFLSMQDGPIHLKCCPWYLLGGSEEPLLHWCKTLSGPIWYVP